MTRFTMMTAGNRQFVDTNILLTSSDADRERHLECRRLLESALAGDARLFTSGQVLREYLVVATRPRENNGLGMHPTHALENVAAFLKCIQVLEEHREVADRLATLIRRHQLTGKRIHDANIAATMLEHGLNRLLTLNPRDFSAFAELELVAV